MKEVWYPENRGIGYTCYKTLDDDNTYSPGRTDPTGKITVQTTGSQKMTWDTGDKYFDHALDDVE